MTEQRRFLYSEFFTMTLMATVQRGKVYRPGLSEIERKPLQLTLQQCLTQISERYKSVVTEEEHEQNIVNLAKDITTAHGAILSDGIFRIGSAQKALNLFLKYLWCIGAIAEPPHCPFDFQIIQKLPAEFQKIRWTQIDDIETYKELVAAAKTCADSLSLAEWELRTYTT